MIRLVVGLLLSLPYLAFSLAHAHSGDFAHAHTQRRHPPVYPRSVLPEGTTSLTKPTYDYVICGGGLAGLVLANRLTENPNITVAVIEAGSSGYETDQFNTPAATFYTSSLGGKYDWAYTTVPQDGLDGLSKRETRGKVLGGGTAINGLYMVRPPRGQLNSWASLNNASDWWGWTNVINYFRKSETFSPPVVDMRSWVLYDQASHGNNGPVNVTWSGVSYPVVKHYLEAWTDLGAKANDNAYGGDNSGPFLALSCINPSNWTRSFARTAYLDPIVERPNLEILTGNTCTKINLVDDGTQHKKATGVNYQADASSTSQTVQANREVLVTGGAIGTPHLLQLSGIGRAAHLSRVGVEQQIELEGVGWGFSDHLATKLDFHAAPDTVLPPRLTGNPQTDSFVNEATSYNNLSLILGSDRHAYLRTLREDFDNIVDGYVGAPPSVLKGYRQTLNETLNLLEASTPVFEYLFASVMGSMSLQVALQLPLSRGSVQITSNDPFDSPAIDPGWLQSPYDLQLFRSALDLARRLGNRPRFAKYHVGESTTTASLSGEGWDDYIKRSSGSEYHPQSSCAMLPLEQGGCVNASLIVYGTRNLRVVDSSVPPAPLSTHREYIVEQQ